MGIFKEFKQFAVRGNVMDLAVGIVIGAAFGKIVTSFVENVLMPPIGLLLGRADFANKFVDLTGKGVATIADAKAAGVPTLNYGLFINALISFVIVAFAVFMLVKWVNHVRARIEKQPEAPAPTQKTCEHCAMNIPMAATRCPNCTSVLKK
jgi:large conductance mechanosensitive channel